MAVGIHGVPNSEPFMMKARRREKKQELVNDVIPALFQINRSGINESRAKTKQGKPFFFKGQDPMQPI